MHKLTLMQDEAHAVRDLLTELTARHDTVEDPEFLRGCNVYAHELPRRVRMHLNDFRLYEPPSACCVLSGYPIDDDRIGFTPAHWKNRVKPSPVLAEEMLLVLFGSLLGDVIGWATQQDGSVVHDIVPIKGHEGEQLGSGSEQLLWWHTEDAFHPCRGDYLGMMCLRNPDQVATTFASLEEIELSEEQRRLLFEDHFTIRPDESHLIKNKSDGRQVNGELSVSYQQIDKMNSQPEKIAVLFGDPQSPYIRIDPFFMDKVGNAEAQKALDGLVQVIDQKLGDLLIMPGDFCFIDNFKGVHGRRPFRARYDGKDRWLKRINITRDLRRSRTARPSADNRVIY
jgi:Fe(II)/alpha-ketoglutarate-dependent arginine beta-hydroxylase